MTPNDNLAYQEETRTELVNGRVTAMSPAATNHNRIAGNIHTIFNSYLKGKKCVSFGDGEALFLTPKDHFIPDGMVVCDRSKIKPRGVYGAPELLVEILSPSTAKNDRDYKKKLYESCGVTEYWIVDPVWKAIEVYLLSEGQYSLDNVYYFHSEQELAEMTEDEKNGFVTAFKCHLFDNLTICLDDIFGDLF